MTVRIVVSNDVVAVDGDVHLPREPGPGGVGDMPERLCERSCLEQSRARGNVDEGIVVDGRGLLGDAACLLDLVTRAGVSMTRLSTQSATPVEDGPGALPSELRVVRVAWRYWINA